MEPSEHLPACSSVEAQELGGQAGADGVVASGVELDGRDTPHSKGMISAWSSYQKFLGMECDRVSQGEGVFFRAAAG